MADWLVGDDIAKGRLVELFPYHHCTATKFDTGAWALYPSRSFLPRKVRVMIDFIRQKLANTRSGQTRNGIPTDRRSHLRGGS